MEFMALLSEVAEADPVQIPTALFVISNQFAHFDDYWNWSLICPGHHGIYGSAE